MAPFKSAGEDGIYPILLQKVLGQLLNPLCSIYRASLALGYIPNIWILSRVAFLPKPGKTDYTTFRPIRLSSFVLEGLEKLIDRYLHGGPLVTVPLHPRQHAFQTGLVCRKCRPSTGGRMEKALDAKEYALGVFFDIEGAFDNTSSTCVKNAVADWEVHRAMCNWIAALIHHRIVNTTMLVISASRGLPQGGGLSPLM